MVNEQGPSWALRVVNILGRSTDSRQRNEIQQPPATGDGVGQVLVINIQSLNLRNPNVAHTLVGNCDVWWEKTDMDPTGRFSIVDMPFFFIPSA